MPESEPRAAAAETSIDLVCRRLIAAPADRCFAAWTEPEQIQRWFGPAHVRCAGAEIDLRIGGRWRIGNEHADGSVLWICGRYELIEQPHRLVYSWAHEPIGPETEWSRVSVRFKPRDEGTAVIVVHERLASEASREMHELGWQGCLQSLAELLA